MLDKTASTDYQKFGEINDEFMDALRKRKEFKYNYYYSTNRDYKQAIIWLLYKTTRL